jgi:hypothetical protein
VKDSQSGELQLGKAGLTLKAGASLNELSKVEIERKYLLNQSKIRNLDMALPRLKQQIREFFDLSATVRAVYLQIDDFYHLTREDQPLVMDYIRPSLQRPASVL